VPRRLSVGQIGRDAGCAVFTTLRGSGFRRRPSVPFGLPFAGVV
jgi:hypothetical protein